jgi:hypothetical protein
MAAAVAIAATVGAAQARAQALTRFATVETQGGFVIFNDKATFWAETSPLGAVTRGWIQVERTFRGGGSILMHGRMDRAETLSLWRAIYRAKPWAAAQSNAPAQNPDFPDTVVTYMGRYTQRVLGAAANPGAPAETADMAQFIDEAAGFVQRTGAGDLFTYHAAGGRAGYVRDIVISRSGAISDAVSFAAAGFGPGYQKQGQLTAQQVNALVTACASWGAYPKAFPGNPQMVDAIGITLTYTSATVPHTIDAGDASSRPASFQAVIDMVEGLANQLP